MPVCTETYTPQSSTSYYNEIYHLVVGLLLGSYSLTIRTMSTNEIPSTMRAWQYSSTQGGLEKHLQLKSTVAVPVPGPDRHLVKVLAMSVNPADYKMAEVQFIHRMAIPKPASPGFDFAGRILRPAKDSDLKEGDLIFGAAGDLLAGAALAEYAAVPAKEVTIIPRGVSVSDAASITMAGLTAWQSFMPHIKSGSKIFLNGGSGGVGQFAIQIAKQAGAHVTTSCSTANVNLCKSLGADEVVDYKASPLIDQLQAISKDGRPFDLVVDYVGSDYDLYWKMHTFSSPHAKFIFIGLGPTLSFLTFFLKAMLTPAFLGGGQRKLVVMTAQVQVDQLKQIAQWMAEGKIKSTVAEKFDMDSALEAYRSSKSGRAKGKIVVEIA